MVSIGGVPNPWRAGRNSSGARLELINRSGNGENVLKRALAKVKPEESGDAHFRFGKPSRFTLTTPEQRTNPGSTVTWPPDDPNDPQDGIVVLDFDEVDRKFFEEKIRIENPDDPEQFVMVQDTEAILFVGRADGIYRRFNFKPQSE
ncbi:hypothetical protein [Mesorhizobium sp.]|uniref:hypothetical protein n=1 Tax=Mesorhizobium sp. TaxID=1871066 RepID=UPI000FE32503|nr:hypothetical protein [Mesorhizobium sp.]RWQ12328.1 MAG: hypothetical protein EOR91_01040 [Mesorhizobium sp.]